MVKDPNQGGPITRLFRYGAIGTTVASGLVAAGAGTRAIHVQLSDIPQVLAEIAGLEKELEAAENLEAASK